MAKRKRIMEEFDFNKSDPEDENFDPTDVRPRKSSKKPRSSKGTKSGRRRNNRYAGSDIEDDDDDILSDSQDDSLNEDGSDDADDDDDDDAPLNAAGRKTRRAAVTRANYRESTEDDDLDLDLDTDGDVKANVDAEADDLNSSNERPRPATRRMVKLKVPKPTLSQSQSTRRTRAKAEDSDNFIELSASGRHAVASRDSRSKSPEALARSARGSRAVKGLKTAPEPIQEATQESSARETSLADEPDELAHDVEDPAGAEQQLDDQMVDLTNEDEATMRIAENIDLDAPAEEEQGEDGEGMNGQASNGDNTGLDRNDVDEDDEDDEVPTTGRTRAARAAAMAEASKKAAAEAESANGSESGPRSRTRRLTRKAGMKKSTEPSSDFEPGDESDSDKDRNMDDDDEDDDDDNNNKNVDSPTPRGRQTRSRGRSRREARRRRSSADEEEPDFDLDELNEEARELRQTSRPRRRAARHESPIVYQDSPRRPRKNVNYYMPPLNAVNVEEEAEEQAPARNRRRGGMANGWDRNLNTTFGPFGGGGGDGSLLNGPWGTGATGGVDSDSSDDEMMHRSNAAGNVGMTPTSAAPPGGLIPGVAGLGVDGAGATPNVGKIKDRKALADADPLGVDLNVDFSKVGGLQGHIDQLKEMVQLPLLYPELFARFHVTPPRGVLFHGPPGTGKTLLARALANSVGSSGRKISFYMRKGADALSKWVGEAEKQLRLLFEEARRTQPSIIFFDEIDGLAPVRSSKQEQIHASIVSTLLALMDGMDGRGQVIVIGATNRPDNIDPALRRPGRFDREFYFPLPDLEGRRSILDIHTKDWGLSSEFKMSLAESTKGYGGADMRALCTEAALNAIQRSYPQIYSTQEKLLVDASKISVHASDFMISVKKMIPSSERSATSGARPLPHSIAPLLRDRFAEAKRALETLLPRKKKTTALEEAMFEQFDDADHGFGRETLHQEFERSRVFRPRFLIAGSHGMGQGYIASAVLHYLEGVHVQNFDLPSLLGDGRPMEQVIVALFTEVRRHKPSVIYIPNIDAWFETLTGTVALITFQTMLKSIPPTDPILLLGTADVEVKELPEELLRTLFGFSRKNRMEIQRPRQENRMEYFSKTLEYIKKKPAEFPDLENRKKRVLEELPLAPTQEPKPPTKEEMKALKKRDHQMLNALKIQLQPIMDQINRRYKKFRQPVIQQSQINYLFAESDPHYVRADIEGEERRPYEIVKDKHGNDVLRDTATGKCYYNLETTTIEERLSNGFYARPKDFLFDIKALAKDAKNFGDKERTLKANELLSNVEVDVASIENSTAQIDWEALYKRQQQRAKEAAEKERKRKAMQQIVERVQSDLGGGGGSGGNDSDSQGPLTLGEPVPGLRTMARFQVRSPLSNGHGYGDLSNGTSQGQQKEDAGDVRMTGSEEEASRAWPMGPPPRTQDQSGMTQLSQRSALTSLPPGMSPSAILNEASTTKSSDPSTQRSANWGTTTTTRTTNGGQHEEEEQDDNEEMPDTLLLQSQITSSEESWLHMPSHSHSHSHSHSQGLRTPASGSREGSSIYHPAGSGTGSGMGSNTQARGAGSSVSQPLAVDGAIERFLAQVTQSTSGCSIEQLEQVNREMMDEIWRTRHEWNRMKVLDCVTGVFNETMVDIESMQKMEPASQGDEIE